MAYKCLDCSYKAAKRFPGGCCPACGSFKIKKPMQVVDTEPEKRKRTIVEILMVLFLWGVLIKETYELLFT